MLSLIQVCKQENGKSFALISQKLLKAYFFDFFCPCYEGKFLLLMTACLVINDAKKFQCN